MPISVVGTRERPLRQGKRETRGEARPGEAGSFGSPPGPSGHWSKMEGLRDRRCVAPSSAFSVQEGETGRAVRAPLGAGPARGAGFRRRTDLAAPLGLSADGSEAWPLRPAVSAAPVFFLSRALPRFPSHKAFC